MEFLDIVDENGNPTGQVVERTVAHAQGIPHRTSHVWLLRQREHKTQILLQKRCSTKDSFPGCYDISSAGHIPAGCSFEESAVRELAEELGVDVKVEDLQECGLRTIVTDEVFYGKPFHDRQVSKVFVLWYDREESDFSPQESELDGVLWMDLNDCLAAVQANSIPHCICLEELKMIVTALQK